jgi:hypothetical protein
MSVPPQAFSASVIIVRLSFSSMHPVNPKSAIFVFHMEAMQKPVDNRGGHDTHGGKHRQSRIEGIAAGEDFTRRGLNRGNRPHPSENHRRIEKRIEPGKVLGKMVAADAGKERTPDEHKGKTNVSELSYDKLGSGKERLLQPFKFGWMGFSD